LVVAGWRALRWENRHVRVYNFSAGPAMLPVEVLQQAQAELLDWRGGMSVLEVSHRGADFVEYAARTEASLRELMAIPDDYRVLFLQGGAMGQFAAIPMNLARPGDVTDYVITGQWGKKAAAEATRLGYEVHIAADTWADGYRDIPDTINPDPRAKFVHFTPNETIGGVEFHTLPQVAAPLVADASSTILSRPIDVAKYGLIYAGAQKNLGPAGMAVVIVRHDLLEAGRSDIPTIWDYRIQAANDSMINTPPTFAIYLLGLVLDWVRANGGTAGMAERNSTKAGLLYEFIDGNDFYANPVAPRARSWMNVPFTLANPELDGLFLQQADAAGLTNLKGHRSVGGMRASIYNAMPLEGVAALVNFMADFAARNG